MLKNNPNQEGAIKIFSGPCRGGGSGGIRRPEIFTM